MTSKAQELAGEAIKLSTEDFDEFLELALSSRPETLSPEWQAELEKRLNEWDDPSKWLDGPSALAAIRNKRR